VAAAHEHAHNVEKLAEIGQLVASTLDRDRIAQQLTEAATGLTPHQFGAFFYNVHDSQSGNAYTLYTLSGAKKADFAGFPHPRATAIFAPTLYGRVPGRCV